MNLKLPILAMALSASSLVFGCDAVSEAAPEPESVEPAQSTSYAPEQTSEFDVQPMPLRRRGPGSDMTTLAGRVVNLRDVAVEDSDVDHLIGDIQTDSGRTFLVDLGPEQTLKERSVHLGAGDTVTVQANPGMFNGASMLVASRINNTDLAFNDNRDLNALTEGNANERIGIRERTISGKIQDVKDVPIQGQAGEHVLAKIETFKGHTAIVDLGARKQLPNVSLQPGTQIAAFGTVGRLNGLPLIVAEKVAQIQNIAGRELPHPNEAATFEQGPNAQQPVAQRPANSNPDQSGENEEPPTDAMERAR